MAKGRKTGGGSRKGCRNKSTRDIKNLIDSLDKAQAQDDKGGMERILAAIFERALGVEVQEPDARAPGGVHIYSLPPDVPAAKLLIEMRYGKAKESISVDANLKVKPPAVLVVPEKRKV